MLPWCGDGIWIQVGGIVRYIVMEWELINGMHG